MKAMILAAGRGERMLPLTKNSPKPLLLVHGIPLIEHRIIALKRAGIWDIVINVHYLGEQIVAYLGDGQRLGVAIKYSKEPDLLETAGGIRNALPLLGTAPFLVVPADTMMDMDFSELKVLPRGSEAHLVMVDNPQHNPNGDYAIEADGKLSLVGTKLTYSSVALFSPRYFSALDAGPHLLRDLFQESIGKKQISGEYFNGSWVDIGTPKRLKEFNDYSRAGS
ncbi:MAG: nucleotidyltransferase family protein [Pseudomonadales bacterium]|nr:nucleotidyltransferase family protein [Pseudomonadales bacterium]